MYQIDENEIPTDIQIMINNRETGLALLRIAELIGQDKIERIEIRNEPPYYVYISPHMRTI